MKATAQISNMRRWLIQEYDIREEYVKAFIEIYDKVDKMEKEIEKINKHYFNHAKPKTNRTL